MNPYFALASNITRLLEGGRNLPRGGLHPLRRPDLPEDAPQVLIFAPHPDDECIVGGLALRLMREAQMRVADVAVTLGSNKARRAARFQELRNACEFLGFELIQTGADGLEGVNLKTRSEKPDQWKATVEVIAKVLALRQPKVIFFPHENDWNSTHVGTHHLLMDALRCQPAEFNCHVVETEFWGQMTAPNLMVQLNSEEVGDLMAGVSFHIGEVERNPYHLFLPAWMQDNVRRGAELVGGQGGGAPDFTYATLYRLRRWRNGAMEEVAPVQRLISCHDNPGILFA